MPIVTRLLWGIGIFVVGYYLGREVSRLDAIKRELGQKPAETE
jgi:hypothetical protein